MRLNALALLAAATAVGQAQHLEKQNPTEGILASETPVSKSPVSDSVPVPPSLELTPGNWTEAISSTRWLLVKHYSPYCPHCLDFAPIYEAAHEEFHKKLRPPKEPGSTPEEAYHDLRFAMVNCVAHADFCDEHEIRSYPTTILYDNGTIMAILKGDREKEAVLQLIAPAVKGLKSQKPSDVGSPKPDSPQKQIGKPDKTQKLLKKANPDGVSELLTPETFQAHVTMTQDPWFIKFYAPLCHHCQAMAPAWEQLSKSMQGKLNIGEVNCEKESRLCKDVGARAFPTVMFFKGGERAEYTGLRGLGDFIQYAEKAVDLASGIPDVDVESLKELEKKEDVIFVYFYDHATTSEDFMALERLPLSLIGHAKLVKTKDPKLYDRFKITTWPRLLVSREGRPTYYPPLTPDDMRDVRGVLDWMRSVWLPLVPELTPPNAHQTMDGKIVVLGVFKHDDQDAFQTSLREMKSVANEWMDRQIQEFQLERKKLRDSKQMRIEEAEDRGDQRALRAAKAIRISIDTSGRKEVTFAWVDGVYWQRWIRTTYGIDVKDGERIIINDEDNRRYWDNTATGNYILVSRTSIMETLDKVVYGPHVIKPKLTVSALEKVLLDICAALFEHPLLSLGCIVGIGFGVFSRLRRHSRRRGGDFRIDDTMGIKELKDGLLGSNGNPKAD